MGRAEGWYSDSLGEPQYRHQQIAYGGWPKVNHWEVGGNQDRLQQVPCSHRAGYQPNDTRKAHKQPELQNLQPS